MYRAPVDEIAFTLKHVAGLKAALDTGLFGDLSEDLVDAILAEAGRFATEEVAPLYKVGDAARRGPEGRRRDDAARLEGALPALDRRRLERAVRAGRAWRPGPAGHARHRGARNVEFRRDGVRHRTDADHGRGRGDRQARQRRAEVDLSAEARLGRVDGHDEPHRAAGRLRSQRARSRAPSRPATARYRIFGTKIFITYGEHDFTDNIVHLVLARLPDAPPGTRGLSLFLVPEIPGRCGWQPRRAQRRVLRRHRAQARHPRLADLHA